MKKTSIGIVLAASLIAVGACEPNKPCMDPEEKGTVVRAESILEERCGRGANSCILYSSTYMSIDIGGVVRTCQIPESNAKMFKPGEVINLMTGRRL
jgi:hypothetical protein